MKIAMRIKISGGRGDGTAWPDPGVPFDVDRDEGVHLCSAGMAYPVADEAAAEMPDVQAAADVEVRSGPPSVRAAKEDWVAHAVAQGADPGEAAAATKADLVASYGKGNGN